MSGEGSRMKDMMRSARDRLVRVRCKCSNIFLSRVELEEARIAVCCPKCGRYLGKSGERGLEASGMSFAVTRGTQARSIVQPKLGVTVQPAAGVLPKAKPEEEEDFTRDGGWHEGVIRKGYLDKRGESVRSLKRWKKRWVMVTPSVLMYYVDKEDGTRERKGIVNFDGYLVTKDEKEPFGIVMRHPEFRNFHFRAQDSDTQEAWLDDLREALDGLQEEGSTSSSSLVVPPVHQGFLSRYVGITWNKVWIVLTKSFVHVFSKPQQPHPDESIPLSGVSLQSEGIMDSLGVAVGTAIMTSGVQSVFVLRGCGVDLVFSCSDEDQKAGWIEVLQTVLEETGKRVPYVSPEAPSDKEKTADEVFSRRDGEYPWTILPSRPGGPPPVEVSVVKSMGGWSMPRVLLVRAYKTTWRLQRTHKDYERLLSSLSRIRQQVRFPRLPCSQVDDGRRGRKLSVRIRRKLSSVTGSAESAKANLPQPDDNEVHATAWLDCFWKELSGHFVLCNSVVVRRFLEVDDWFCALHAKNGGLFVESLLRRGVSLDVRDKGGRSPLHIAVAKCDKDLVAKIIERERRSIKWTDMGGNMPIHIAVRAGHNSVLQLLLEMGASPDSANAAGHFPLSMAASEGYVNMIHTLETHAVYVPKHDAKGRTALHRAVSGGHVEATRELIRMKVPIDERDASETTAMEIAAESGNEKLVKLLIDGGANVQRCDNIAKETPLHIACAAGHRNVAALLADAGAHLTAIDARGDSPLRVAVGVGAGDVVKLLLERGVSPMELDGDGLSPTHVAAIGGYRETFEMLLVAGCNPDDRDECVGRTCLLWAVVCNQREIVHDLVQMKTVNVNLAEKGTQRNALHLAAMCGNGSVARELLEKDIECNSPSGKKALTPLHLSVVCRHVCFVKATISTIVQAPMALFLASNAKIDVGILSSVRKECALFMAASSGQPSIASILVKEGADVNAIQEQGKTALMIALEHKHYDVMDVLLDLDTIDPDIALPSGDVALHIAVRLRDDRMIKKLVESGASTRKRNNDGLTPVQVASSDMLQVFEYLRAHAAGEV